MVWVALMISDNAIHFMLRTVPAGHDLDNYIFESAQHAVSWLKQYSDAEESFKIALVHLNYSRNVCPQCGHRTARPGKIVRTLRASRFLEEYGDDDG